MTVLISTLTISFSARLNGLESGVPFNHSFIFGVAGSLGASIEYALNTHLRCKATSGDTMRAQLIQSATAAWMTRGSAFPAACTGPAATVWPSLSTSTT